MPADRIYNVLFLCTGNSARSVMGEVLLNTLGAGRFRAYSAGSHPKGAVHPMTLEILRRNGLSVEGLRSKSWDEFSGPGAPQMDFVFTVCDDAAGEACPIWPGHPITAHWGMDDPARVAEAGFAQEAAFEEAFKYMRNRVAAFVSLPMSGLDRLALTGKLQAIGSLAGTTSSSPRVA